MESMYSVPLSELIEKMGLENLTPEIDTENILIKHIDVNRPALQLAGFFDYFDSERIQVIGNVENAFLQRKSEEDGIKVLTKLMDYKIPCLIFCRGIEVHEKLIAIANEKRVPICAISLPQEYLFMEYL